MEGRGRPTTLVLVGRTGNGKSATGNSILGSRDFKSRNSSNPVTATSELQQVQLKIGRKLNVIDTPGLFDPNVKLEFLGQEIVKCIDLAKDGLHGVLLVLSVKNRFSAEEAAALETLETLFGEKIRNYMVVIFTGGDELEDNEQTLEEYLRDSSPALQNLLRQCNDRKVLFDNKTKSETKKEKQITELLKQIDIVMAQNGGHPYSNEMFCEAQEWSNRRKEIDSGGCSKQEMEILLENMEKRHAEQLKKTTKMVEEKLRMSTKLFEQKLAAEKSARQKVERESHETIRKLKEKLPKPPPPRPLVLRPCPPRPLVLGPGPPLGGICPCPIL